MTEITVWRNPDERIVKVCGIKSVDSAQVALENGAHMIGMILAPGRARTVTEQQALEISAFVHSYQKAEPYEPVDVQSDGLDPFEYNAQCILQQAKQQPKIVGVFRNQSLEEVLRLQKALKLDYVQLHGSEPLEWCDEIPVPVIKRFVPGSTDFSQCLVTGKHVLSLVDGELGGEGALVDWNEPALYAEKGARFILAGGLTSDNVRLAWNVNGIVGVDVSGGVETEGTKDPKKIEEFVVAALQ